MDIHIKRVYESPSPDDGRRILVDRLWPRGLSRQKADIDLWAKQLAPSTELRRWFGHDQHRFHEFGLRYRRELDNRVLDLESLCQPHKSQTLTLLYAARSADCNHAIVLRSWLVKRLACPV